MFKKILRKLGSNPLEVLLKKSQAKGQKRFLFFWNRGLGDIALGLYAIVHRIREYIPDAEITFLTRPNLYEGFILLGNVQIKVIPGLKRGDEIDISQWVEVDKYDVIIKKPDPTHWVAWQHGKLTPLLQWKAEWDLLWEQFPLDPNEKYVGAHVQTETQYANWRNWPRESWKTLFQKITGKGKKVLLFGFEKDPYYSLPGVIDLRGETPLFSLLSIIKNRCESLVVPDSGISSMVYFLNTPFSITHISLWADPYMGILKQNVASPNALLKHIPLLGKNKDITNISIEEVYKHLNMENSLHTLH